jgi:energy-coupling factor transporter transmembrane protein EcfT
MYRAVGMIFDPPVVGSVLGILWTGLFMRFDHHGMSLGKVPTIIKLLLVAIFLSVIFLYSRSTYISLLFVTSIYLVSKKRWTYLAVFIGLALFAIRFAPLSIPTTMNLESSKLDRFWTTCFDLRNGGILLMQLDDNFELG